MFERITLWIAIPAVVAGMAFSASAQEPGRETPTVGVRPANTTRSDPNEGIWFYETVTPGGSPVRFEALLTNTASVDQRVRMYLSDLNFTSDGAPVVAEQPTDIGTWGVVETGEACEARGAEPLPGGCKTATVPAGEEIAVIFSIQAPQGADPGDHVGAFVVESAPTRAEGSGVAVVKRVATRVYATVPGDATPGLQVEQIEISKSSAFFTREVTLTIGLRNSGRIRLHPRVEVNGEEASGTEVLLSRAVEKYVVTLPVGFFGGPQSYRVDVTSRTVSDTEGPARQATASTFVIPWHLLPLAALAVGFFFAGRWVWRRRGSKYDALQSDIRRLERLLSGVAVGQQGTEGSLPDDRDPETAIRGAIKQARRAGDEETVRRLEAKLDEVRGTPPEEVLVGDAADDTNPAVAAILRDIADAPPKRQGALIQAARAYGIKELRKHQAAIDELPDEVRVRLLARKSPAKPSSGKKQGPAKRKK